MSNANAQPQKEKGIFVGMQVRCFKLTTGSKADGSMWGLTTYTEKDSSKKVLQKYSLWLKNDSDFIANFPSDKTVDLRIEYIGNVRPEWKSYKDKDGKQITDRVINVEVGVSIINVIDNNFNNNNTYNNVNNNYNNNNNNAGYQQTNNQPTQQQSQKETPINNDFDIDSINFPF